MTSPPAIQVRDLSKRFGKKTVVDAVSLDVPTGSIFGFLGSNGSGKTTCLRMICGLLEPTSGAGTCLGFDILKNRADIKREVGYMTQKFGMYEDLTVRENLDFIALMYAMPNRRKAVNEVLERFALEKYANHLSGILSGGWKQRLSLAACMLHRPRLLLLDEPTAGVDPQARREFWSEIHTLANTGITVLVTTHYMDEAERCTYLAYISRGKVLVRGTPETILQEVGLSTFSLAGIKLREITGLLRGQPGVEMIADFGTRIHVSGKNGKQLRATLDAVLATHPFSIQAEQTTLEDLFIHLMNKPPAEVERSV